MTYKLSAKRVYQIDPETHEVIKVWDSVTDAANAMGVTVDAISQLCKRTDYYMCDENYKPKLVAGFEFEFAPEIIEKRIEKRYRVDHANEQGKTLYRQERQAKAWARLHGEGWFVTEVEIEVVEKME